MEPNICFVCLSSADNSFHDEQDDSSLFSKFCEVSQIYLGISSSSLTNQDGAAGKATFCANCESVVSSVCELHQQLVDAQLRLSSKLGELAELVDSSLSQSSIPTVLETFRCILKEKSEQERLKSVSEVVDERMATEPPPATSNSEEKQEMSTDLPPIDLMRSTEENTACSDPELHLMENFEVGIPIIIKTETLAEATLSRFLDEDENEEQNDYEDDSPQPEPSSSSVDPCAKTKDNNYKVFVCQVCNAPSTTERSLLKHMADVHNPERHACLHCSKDFGAARYLRAHIVRNHPDSSTLEKKRHRCPKCNKPFERRLMWERHISSCNSTPPQKPVQRDRPPPNMGTVQFELEGCVVEVQVEKSKPEPAPSISKTGEVICHKCNGFFKTVAGLKQHLLDIHDRKRQVCNHCQLSFPGQSNLRVHISQHHPDLAEKRLKCKNCSQRFLKRFQYKLHLSTCVSNPQKVAVPSPPRIELEAVEMEQFEDETGFEPDLPEAVQSPTV